MVMFSFRGILTSLDLAHMASTEPTLVALRRRMVDRLGMSEHQASRVTEAILGRALLRYGEHLIAGRGAIVDRVIDLRMRLDDAFETAFAFNARTPGAGTSRATLDANLQEISRLFDQLDAEMTRLGRPLHEIDPPPGTGDTLRPLLDEVGTVPANPAFPHTQRRTPIHDTTPNASGTVRIESGRYRFTRQPDGSFLKTFDDGATAVFRVENGRFRVEMFEKGGARIGEAAEYAVLHTPYGRRPRTTAMMQANHGYQNSTMTRLFERYGYDGDAVPTIWMRDSRRGSPHGMVTAEQNAGKAMRNASGVTLADIRRWTVADLRHSGMPDAQIAEYIRAIDNHFMVRVYPNIPANRRTALLGNWRPGAGL
jgi:hypothetical protein